ncbi:MAG: efflux RND transporter permease subunit [Spongiibacteraceae bacterium]|nr:efflux RND transporter permease subunit [Spongiibacteraceae bacterium]
MSNTPADKEHHRGIIAWFAYNSVASNLLMIAIIAAGIYSLLTIQRSMQPRIELNIININMVYPGAAPEEVERGIILKIEEVLKDIEAIKRVTATASESLASLSLEIYDNFELLAVLDEVKSAVDSVSSFPEQAEKPTINRLQIRDHVMNIQLYGNLDETGMKALVEEVKEGLLQDPDIAYVSVYGARDYEIAIEIDEITLRKYNLTLEKIATAIRNSSLDLPGGAIKTDNGDIMLRTKGQAYNQYDFENVVLLSYADGTRLTLGEIASINDGFVEQLGYSLFDQQFSMGMTVHAVGEQDLLAVATAAKKYIEKKRQTLPPDIHIDHWADATFYLQARLDMMLKNLMMGALLVFLILGLFLNIKLAFWVMVGLPVCFLGTFALMPIEHIAVTLNMISLFGFILVLGIVVDDAIIIAESCHQVTEEKGHSTNNVIEGALRVATPATFGVLTTIVAFIPTLMAEGVLASFPAAFGWVVILCLIFSLIESKWILPAHLANIRPSNKGLWGHLNKIPQFTNQWLMKFVKQIYQPFLRLCIRQRYTTFSVFIALLIITIGLIAGGVVRFILLPDVPSDFINAKLEMVEGTADWKTRTAHDRMAKALSDINTQYKIKSGNDEGFIHHVSSWSHSGLNADFIMELTKQENRSISTNEIVSRWREKIGEIPDARVMSVSNFDGSSPSVAFKLSGSDITTLTAAALELQNHITTYDGTFDIRNSTSTTRNEIVLSIKPSAQALGLTLADLASQVRQAFYGAEAQRIQRGTNEIKVMVRYPKEQRKNISHLENMNIRTADGDEVPFGAVATIDVAPSYGKTTRIDSSRAITVSALVDKAQMQPNEIVNDITANFMPQLMQRYPGINYKLDGESEETVKMFNSLFLGFALALFGIYGLLAIPLKSYSQPLIIMGVIPFGIIGAIVGHIIIDIPFNMMSFFGIIALSGVVVNDSLIMVDFINTAVKKGTSKIDAVMQSGGARFRAIMLTSLTTFFGLLPMLMEDSVQAQSVIPMTVSLGFGIIFATVITLLLVPCLYMLLEDVVGSSRKETLDFNKTLTE